MYSPGEWLKRKIATYQRYEVEPYLDHSFFMQAYKRGVVEEAIAAGRELGFRAIEFMNTTDDVSPAQWKSWRKLALELDMRIIPGASSARQLEPEPACASLNSGGDSARGSAGAGRWRLYRHD